ncbi:GtrA family protein [Corynebacterium kutscheri]|nr:GtrA family protein [Corynebacterium kutscheri]
MRLSRNLRQFIKFGIVGGSGVVVNLAVIYVLRKTMLIVTDMTEHDAVFNLLDTPFHVRWFNVFMTIAFLAANTWNYQLNRMWTFKSKYARSWWRGFFPFLITGLGAFVVSQVLATLLMNPTSPIALSTTLFDDSTGFRTKVYWASAISIIVAMPINFLINKTWAFRKPKTQVILEAVPS